MLLTLGLLLTPACDDAKKDVKAEAPAAADASKTEAAVPAGTPDADADAEPEPEAGVDAEPSPADGGAPPDAAAPVVAKIGVPECDDYIEQMSACFAGDGMPEEIRAAHKEGFETSVKGWADALERNPDSKASIGIGCKAAIDMAKRSYPKCFEQ